MLERVGHREMVAFDRAIDLRINRIRRKIEHDPEYPVAIRTVYGVGYMFVPAPGNDQSKNAIQLFGSPKTGFGTESSFPACMGL